MMILSLVTVFCALNSVRAYRKCDESGLFDQFDEQNVVHVSRPGDFLGFTKLTPLENENVQKICGTTIFDFDPFKMAAGVFAQSREFPWVVTFGAKSTTVTCTGTIISPRHVLTAAHCVNRYQEPASVPCQVATVTADFFVVSYGGICVKEDKLTCPQRDMKEVRMKKYAFLNKFHEGSCAKGGDLALIELEENLDFDDFTRPLCVGNMKTDEFYNPVDLGFGRDEDGKPVAQLRFIKSMIDYYDCEHGNLYGSGGHVNAGKNTTQASVCRGDSGGPTQVTSVKDERKYVIGAHSYGDTCGTKSIFVSTNVLQYVDFICAQTGVCRDYTTGFHKFKPMRVVS